MKPVLKVVNLEKSYPGVKALKGISIDFYPGEIHAIVGENGAGKTTLVEIISGAIKADKGEIVIEGEVFNGGVKEALLRGVAIVHQERNLVPSFNAVQNIFLGNERGFFPDDKAMLNRLHEAMDSLGMYVNTRIPVRYMGEGEKQIVEILKLLELNPKVMIFDEPTAVLDKKEVSTLFNFLRKAKRRGKAIILITHHLEEVFEVADKVTVMRNGEKVATKLVSETNEAELVSLMVNRDIKARYPKFNIPLEEEVLRVKNLKSEEVFVEDFYVRRGEIVGIAGLVGSGRTEFLEALYGARKILSGKLILNGNPIDIRSPRDAIKKGIFLIPEDRDKKALFPRFSVMYNTSLPFLKKFQRFLGILDMKGERRTVERTLRKIKFDTKRLTENVVNLSGGNKQKVSLGRWLIESPNIYLLDEPTQGIDVGVKAEFFRILCEIINELKIGVVLVSSDLPELIAMSDRLYVFRNRKIVDHFDSKERFNQQRILSSMITD